MELLRAAANGELIVLTDYGRSLAEFTSTRGIGHFIMSASQFLATDFVFVGIGIIAACAFSFAMRLIVPWKGQS